MEKRSEKELRELAMDIVENKVFGSWMFRSAEEASNLMGMVFMCALFMAEEDREKLKAAGANHFYEYYDKSLPRSINGKPIFMSMRFILDEEWNDLDKYINELIAYRKKFMGEESQVNWSGPIGG